MYLIDWLARLPVGFSLFILALLHRPTEALRALLTRLTGKRVRAMNMLRRATRDLPQIYQVWLRKIEPSRMASEPSEQAIEPIIVALVANECTTDAMIERSLASLAQQVNFARIILFRSQKTLTDFAGENCLPWCDFDHFVSTMCRKTILLPILAGDVLPPGALLHYSSAFRAAPDMALCYGDEDEIDSFGRRSRPWFKPDWNREQFLAQDFISAAFAARIADLPPIGDNEPDDLVRLLAYGCALAASDNRIGHLPFILRHRAVGAPNRPDAGTTALLAAHLPVGTSVVPFREKTRRVDWPLPVPVPLITVIVPTRDRVDLLRQCVEGLHVTNYPTIELIIIDNDSVEPQTLAYFDAIRDEHTHILPFRGAFNFSAMNNRAVANARGSLICFVNNDIEFTDKDWLNAMARQATRAEVGAVGAKLLYPDRRIQHAGVAIGIGGAAGHIHKLMPDDSDSCHSEPHVQRTVSAVTAACLLIAKDKFIEVGGFDEENFAVAFNDVDLCLKLRAAGYINIYTPHAVAIHHESQSRGNDLAKMNLQRYRKELAALQERWDTKQARDANWNPNFDYSCEQQVLRV